MQVSGNFELALERARDARGADLSLSEAIVKRLNGMTDWVPETKCLRIEVIVIDEEGAETTRGSWSGSRNGARIGGTWELRWSSAGEIGYVDLHVPA